MSSSAPIEPSQPAPPRQRRKWLLAFGGLTVLVVLAWLIFGMRGREPVYQGLKITRFIELRGYDDIALAAIELGPDKVVPYLIEALRGEDSSLQRGKMALWKRLPAWYVNKHLSQMPVPAESTRMKALVALGYIGPDASAAVPQVAQVALDDSMRAFAVSTLGQIGVDSSQALEVLLQLITSTNQNVRSGAAMALAQFRERAKPALPTLLREFDRNGPKSPSAAAGMVLAALGAEVVEAMPVLVDALNDDILALYAVSVLRRTGPAAADAVPGLSRYVEARKPRYPVAVEALMNIGPAARPALTVLKQLADETNSWWREGKIVVARGSSAQLDETPAKSGVSTSGPGRPMPTPAYVETSGAPVDGVTRVLAAVAISRIENDPASAIPALVREIQNGTRAGVRSWSPPFCDHSPLKVGFTPSTMAAWFLGEMGPAAREAVPVLASRLTNRIEWTRIVAAQAIWKINQDTNLALPPLLESLQSTNRSDIPFLLSATLLGQLGPAASPAVPHLLKHRRLNWKTLRVASDALKKIQPSEAVRSRP